MDIAEIENELEKRNDRIKAMEFENKSIDKKIDDESKKVKISERELNIFRQALEIVENIANSRRSAIKEQIEAILSEAVSFIYGYEYSVELTYDTKNNRSSLIIELVRKTKKGEIRREMDGFGGGVSDTISVPLRLMVLLSSKTNSPVCILDECYKHMDGERIELVAELLKSLTDKLGIQLIFCSHHETIREKADMVCQISDKNGKSIIENIK